MIDILYKKACGYSVDEITKEYGVDEDGNTKLIKQKVQSKYIPPDSAALKTYMEMKDNELLEMSDEELIQEKKRLLKELKISNK